MPASAVKVFGEYNRLLDSRLTTPRNVNYAYAPPAPATLGECKERAEWVRRRVLIAAGLCPEPQRTPLRARLCDRAMLDCPSTTAQGRPEPGRMGGCSIEKVSFESRPGFLVTGNLYRPLKWRGQRPAILRPHGHCEHGRLERSDLFDIPASCVTLARLGFVVFSYDMVGYVDSCQLDHRWPPEIARRASLYGLSTFGLQLWNSMRAVDFLCGLPDVDAQRIGCTGGSGGATQTYYLAAADARIRVLAPVCMMSSHYQGGCACEEGPLLHLDDLTTLDVVASLAPRPVLLPSVTGDWTNQNPAHDVPAVRQIYATFGAADHVENVHFDAPHNYNRDIREHVYAWFCRWLANDCKVGRRIAEPKLAPVPAATSRLSPDRKPPRGFLTGKALMREMAAREQTAFARPPSSAAELRALKADWRGVCADVLGAKYPQETVSVGRYIECARTPQFTISARALGRFGRGEQTPALWIVPARPRANSTRNLRDQPAALAVCGGGKAELFRKGAPHVRPEGSVSEGSPLLAALLGAGFRVLAIDLLGKGETAPLLERARTEMNDSLYHAFNRSLTAHRVQEVLVALAALRQHDGAERPAIVATGLGAVIALLARPLAGELRGTAVDLAGHFDHAHGRPEQRRMGGCKVRDDAFWLGEMYHPFIRKLGDVRGAVALGPISPLLIAGADEPLSRWSQAVYRLQGKRASLRLAPGSLAPSAVAAWL
jgi:dienelactone hydrolase